MECVHECVRSHVSGLCLPNLLLFSHSSSHRNTLLHHAGWLRGVSPSTHMKRGLISTRSRQLPQKSNLHNSCTKMWQPSPSFLWMFGSMKRACQRLLNKILMNSLIQFLRNVCLGTDCCRVWYISHYLFLSCQRPKRKGWLFTGAVYLLIVISSVCTLIFYMIECDTVHLFSSFKEEEVSKSLVCLFLLCSSLPLTKKKTDTLHSPTSTP